MSENNPAVDSIDDAANATDGAQIQEHLKSRSTWLRLLFMFIFYVIVGLASMVVSFVIVLGFLWVLFTGETNEQLMRTGRGIATYVYQIIEYCTFNTDQRPFPFDLEWPSPDSDATTSEN